MLKKGTLLVVDDPLIEAIDNARTWKGSSKPYGERARHIRNSMTDTNDSGGSYEYMSYFKIVDRTDTIQQAPNSGYDVYKYKIAVCDGGTYDEERGTSSASRFYLNEGYADGYRFPYRESQVFKASSSPLYVQVKMVIQLDIGEKEEGSGDDGEEEIFVPEYSVLVDRDREQEVNTYDYKTGKLTCVFTIGRVSFPEYSRKEVSRLKIIQDHLTGPLRLFWYISCGDVQNDEEEEE